MVLKTLLIFIIVAILMEDGLTIRKSEEEKREEDEMAKAVNKTLAEEEKKRREEEDEKKGQLEQEKNRTETGQEVDSGTGDTAEEKGQNGTCPTANLTCPERKPCQVCERCPEPMECPPCEDCRPCRECGPCPVSPCKPCKPCGPCGPDPVVNCTTDDHPDSSPPSTCPVPAEASMSVPVALLVGASAGVLVTGVTTVIGLLLRYTSPILSGLLFVFIVVLTWYLSSHYPETARELGGRVVATLREATVALGHRIVEAIQRHQEQVNFSC
jgi:hypothetical protein